MFSRSTSVCLKSNTTATGRAQFFIDLKSRLESTPGVQSASTIYPLPLSGDRFSISFEIEGRPMAPKDHPSADFFTTGVGYFRTMGIPVIKGRDFDDRDKHGSTPVIIITETFARQYFPNEDPIGKRIHPGISSIEDEDSTMREIVGVVGDVRNRSLSTEPRAAYYVPQTQVPFSQMVAVVKTTSEPRSLISGSDERSGGNGPGRSVVWREVDGGVLVDVCCGAAFQHDVAFDLCGCGVGADCRRVVWRDELFGGPTHE